MKVLLKENHFWIVLRQKTPSYATLRFLKNQQLLNKLKKKTVFLSRLLRRIRFWNMFLTKSQIRIKIFKISQFLVNFTKLVIFCIGNFTECEILKHIFYHTSALNGNFDNATQFHMKLVSKYQAFLDSLLSKNLFFCQFTPLKCQSWRFPTFLESLFLRALFRKKTCFESKFSRKIRLWTNFFTTPQTFEEKEYFVSKFELNIHIASKLESKVSQRIRFRSEIVFFKKQILMKVLLKENHFWIVLRQKTPSYATLRFLKNQQLLNKLKKKQFSYQDFWEESDFETCF